VTPEPIKDWSPTSLKKKLIKIGAKMVCHGRYVAFQMTEVAIPQQMFQESQPPANASMRCSIIMRSQAIDGRSAPKIPARITRLATRLLFWIPEVSVAVRTLRLSCRRTEKTQIFVADRQSSWKSRRRICSRCPLALLWIDHPPGDGEFWLSPRRRVHQKEERIPSSVSLSHNPPRVARRSCGSISLKRAP
jgi:hypothetical protein